MHYPAIERFLYRVAIVGPSWWERGIVGGLQVWAWRLLSVVVLYAPPCLAWVVLSLWI